MIGLVGFEREPVPGRSFSTTGRSKRFPVPRSLLCVLSSFELRALCTYSPTRYRTRAGRRAGRSNGSREATVRALTLARTRKKRMGVAPSRASHSTVLLAIGDPVLDLCTSVDEAFVADLGWHLGGEFSSCPGACTPHPPHPIPPLAHLLRPRARGSIRMRFDR